jgi:thioredoxin reductase
VLATKIQSQYPNIRLFYETQVDNVDLKRGTFEVTYADGTKEVKHDYE